MISESFPSLTSFTQTWASTPVHVHFFSFSFYWYWYPRYTSSVYIAIFGRHYHTLQIIVRPDFIYFITIQVSISVGASVHFCTHLRVALPRASQPESCSGSNTVLSANAHFIHFLIAPTPWSTIISCTVLYFLHYSFLVVLTEQVWGHDTPLL